jgi:hypothetical protein
MDYHLPAALAMAAAVGHTPSWKRVVRIVAQCSGYIAARGTSTAAHLTGVPVRVGPVKSAAPLQH